MKQLFFLLFLLIPVVSFAEPQQIQGVTATGVGASEREAVEDAFRNAIEESIGLYVDSETKLQNDQLISDNILTSSKGYIHKYRLLSVKNEEGTTKVEIKALVKIQDVKSKLTGLNISTIAASDSAGTFARLSTKLKRSQDANKIFKKEFDDFFEIENILKLLDIKLIGYEIDENKLSQDNTVPYEVSFTISINLENYNKQVIEFMSLFERLGGKLNKSLNVLFDDDYGYAVLEYDKFMAYRSTLETRKEKQVCFGLVVYENEKYILKHYCFPQEWKGIYPWEHEHNAGYLSLDNVGVVLQFKGKDAVVLEKRSKFNSYHELEHGPLSLLKTAWGQYSNSRLGTAWHSSFPQTGYNIAPFIVDGINVYPRITLVYRDKINVDLLYDIQSVEIKLEIKEQ